MEKWIDVIGYEGLYQVSDLGNVKSLERKVNNNGGFRIIGENILKSNQNKYGYLSIKLSKNGNTLRFLTHRLVCLTFLENLENKSDVNHINGIKNDNRLENLEWNTRSENIIHSFKVLNKKSSNKSKFGKDNHLSKGVNQFTLDGLFIKKWDCIFDIQRELNIKKTNISSCCKGKRKTTGNFIWKYI